MARRHWDRNGMRTNSRIYLLSFCLNLFPQLQPQAYHPMFVWSQFVNTFIGLFKFKNINVLFFTNCFLKSSWVVKKLTFLEIGGLKNERGTCIELSRQKYWITVNPVCRPFAGRSTHTSRKLVIRFLTFFSSRVYCPFAAVTKISEWFISYKIPRTFTCVHHVFITFWICHFHNSSSGSRLV